MSDTPEKHDQQHQHTNPASQHQQEEEEKEDLKLDTLSDSIGIMRMAHVTSGIYRDDNIVATLKSDGQREGTVPSSLPFVTTMKPVQNDTTNLDDDDHPGIHELMKMAHITSGIYPEDFLLTTLTAPSQQLDEIAPSQPPKERTRKCTLL